MAGDLRTAVRIDIEGSRQFRGEMRRMGRSLDAFGGSARGVARASHAYRQATARAEAATRASTGSILVFPARVGMNRAAGPTGPTRSAPPDTCRPGISAIRAISCSMGICESDVAAGMGRQNPMQYVARRSRATIYRESAVAHVGAGYPAYPAAGW